MLIFESESKDVYRNLAIEEYLMDRLDDTGPILFLWQSDCAVVMGKNQNPWRECRLDLMKNDGVPLARRISGGGTVYHDEGNLNYCVIVDRINYKEEMAYQMVIEALDSFGIGAEKTGRSNLSVRGRKFSGNAFAFRKGRALHHGTLLLNTNLERLNRYLGPMFERIDTHAIASVPAEVMNLNLNVTDFSAALKDRFRSLYVLNQQIPARNLELNETIISLEKRQASDAWKYNATPRFSLEINGERLEVNKGVVLNTENEPKSFKELAHSLFC